MAVLLSFCHILSISAWDNSSRKFLQNLNLSDETIHDERGLWEYGTRILFAWIGFPCSSNKPEWQLLPSLDPLFLGFCLSRLVHVHYQLDLRKTLLFFTTSFSLHRPKWNISWTTFLSRGQNQQHLWLEWKGLEVVLFFFQDDRDFPGQLDFRSNTCIDKVLID